MPLPPGPDSHGGRTAGHLQEWAVWAASVQESSWLTFTASAGDVGHSPWWGEVSVGALKGSGTSQAAGKAEWQGEVASFRVQAPNP